jgi:hypothetical protein
MGACVTASDDGHDEGSDIGLDAVPAAFRSAPPYDPEVDGTSTRPDEGQDAASAGPQPEVASRPRHRRRWVVLATGLVVIGIAAGVSAITRHNPSVTTGVDSYDVTFLVTGSSHSANMRYSLWDMLWGGSQVTERDNLDLTGPDPNSFAEGYFPRGSHIFLEVRNNLPTGDVGCAINYPNPGSDVPTQIRSAQGASVARCDVDLK